MTYAQNARSTNLLGQSTATFAMSVFSFMTITVLGLTIVYYIAIVNRKIGARNHGVFMGFILSLLVLMISNIVMISLVNFANYISADKIVTYIDDKYILNCKIE